jgi:hypothetical protein
MSKIDDGVSLNDSIQTDEDEDPSLTMKIAPGEVTIEHMSSAGNNRPHSTDIGGGTTK